MIDSVWMVVSIDPYGTIVLPHKTKEGALKTAAEHVTEFEYDSGSIAKTGSKGPDNYSWLIFFNDTARSWYVSVYQVDVAP